VERLRSTIPRPDQVIPEAPDTVPLSPNGQFGAHRVEPPVSEPVSRSAAASVETRERRLDFLFRPRQAHQTHAGPAPRESVEASWSRRPVADVNTADPRLEVARAPSPPPATRAATEPKPAQAPQPRTVAILKSGVVDGMAYTLYADGSIEAQLPQGTVRFGSIAELRAHIENKG
jgi:hypothetical protein